MMMLAKRHALLLGSALALACGGDESGRLRVGQEPAGGPGGHGAAGLDWGAGNAAAGAGVSGTAGEPSSNALTVRVEDIDEMVIEVITVQCEGECVDVVAVARGGHPPYDLEWDDGSTDPRRRVCPSENVEYTVSVTDTALDAEEFEYEPHTATAVVTANVLSCGADAGVDASVPEPTCEGGVTAVSDVMGAVVHFDGGAALAAGRYRVAYLDGCMKFGPPVGWSIHNLGVGSWFLVGATSAEQIDVLPGVVGLGYESFDECITASRAQAALELDFAGGQLGVWLFDAPYTDNVAGEDGKNPTWCLTHIEP